MQLYARDQKGESVAARWAETQKKYCCLECGAEVRVRRGGQRREHFFHLKFSSHCNSSGKGIVHLHIQETLCRLLPENETQMEVPFKAIGRIADVVWEKRKVVFEVQCAPISAKEVLERIADYRFYGYQVIWILHRQRYGQERLSSAEKVLQSHTHYYTDIEADGKGFFYDCCYVSKVGFLNWKTAFIPVVIGELKETAQLVPSRLLTQELKRRKQSWRLHCQSDWLDLFCRLEPDIRVEEVLKKWPKADLTIWMRVKKALERYFLRPYRLIFQILLEQSCRRH